MFEKLICAAILGLCTLTAPLWAHDYTVGDLQIIHPRAFETPPTAMTGGGFLTIVNDGDAPERLIEVRADFPKVELHQTVMKDGVGRMLPVEGLDVPPGGTVVLEPGGYHIMFMGLQGRQLKAGEDIPGTLVFERAGEVPVTFRVEKRPEGTGMKMQHDGHDTGASE